MSPSSNKDFCHCCLLFIQTWDTKDHSSLFFSPRFCGISFTICYWNNSDPCYPLWIKGICCVLFAFPWSIRTPTSLDELSQETTSTYLVLRQQLHNSIVNRAKMFFDAIFFFHFDQQFKIGRRTEARSFAVSQQPPVLRLESFSLQPESCIGQRKIKLSNLHPCSKPILSAVQIISFPFTCRKPFPSYEVTSFLDSRSPQNILLLLFPLSIFF